MPSRSLGALLALVVLVVATGAVGIGSSAVLTDGASEGSGEPSAAVETHTPGPNATRDPAEMTLHLQIQADGDARWQVSATYEIRDDADRAAFDALGADFEDGDASLALETLALARENASAATGREMTFRNVERTASRNATTGVGTLTLAFTWSNFARVEGDRLYVGDAFNATEGTWLPRLTERQTLVVEPPAGYGVVSAPQVGIEDGTARWEGPYRFDGREPWIVYAGEAPATTVGTTALATTLGTTPPQTTTTGGGNGGGSSIMPVALLVLVAAASAVLLAVYVHRGNRPGSGRAEPDDTGGDGGAAARSEPAGDDATRSTEGSGETEESADTSEESTAGVPTDDAVDEALLSDEERVERLIERNGGRMKQADIVKETGWSNAKVSQLLSSMAEDDRIDKLRIGRENLISFPDEDVADFTSDDED